MCLKDGNYKYIHVHVYCTWVEIPADVRDLFFISYTVGLLTNYSLINISIVLV